MDRHELRQVVRKYKINWKTGTGRNIVSEAFDTFEGAKARGRELLVRHDNLIASVWDEEETWQVVTPARFREWCMMP
jgi:hypothetical protein